MKENIVKHLEMIQSTIDRLAKNSFSLKGFTVTIVAGIFALSSKDADKPYFLFSYIPILAFWFLDSYYLMEERRYRNLFNYVRKQPDNMIDYDMDANRAELRDKRTSYLFALFSKTIFWFYAPFTFIITGIVALRLLFIS